MATESRLADIYRQELKKSGLLGALLSASGARMKEKTDIRRMLPQSGISGAAFEKMFGKAYKYGANKGGGVRDTNGGGSGVSKSMEEKLTRIGVDSKLTAKNTIVLPAMARDMNVMRLNMQKMVKLSGGTATKSSDMFFKRASDRESQYESQYKRNSGGLAPTPVVGKKEGGGFLGMLGSLLGGAKDIVSAFGGFFKGLFGVILASGIIGQFLQDPETRANFLDFIKKFLKGFFDGIKNVFEVVGEALKDKEVQASIAGAIKSIFNAILEVFKVELTKIETPFGDLSVTIGDVVGAFVGFKIAMIALETAILLRAANIGRGGGMGLPGGPGAPDKGKSGAKGGRGEWLKTLGKGLAVGTGVGLIGEGIAYYLEQGESVEDARKKAQEDIDNQAKESFSPGEEIVPKKPEGMRGSEIARTTGEMAGKAIGVYGGVKALSALTPSAPIKVADPFDHLEGKKLTSGGSVRAGREIEKNKTLWEKIARVMKRAYEKGVSTEMLRKIFKKFGFSVAAKLTGALAGVVAAPFSVGASLLITALGVYMLASDVIDLYDWFIEYEKELDAFEKASSPTPVTTPAASPNVSPSPSPSSTQAGTMGAYTSRAGTRSTSPTPSGGGAIPSNGQVDPGKTTFADLTVEQQNAFFAEQRKQEGYKPGSLSYDLNNPGNMLYAPWQRKYGGELDTTGRGVGTVKGKFAKFPTLQDGVEAQRALWMSPKYSSLPLDKALNLWVTGNKDSDMDINMRAKNTNYKSGIYAAIGGAPTTTLASASPSTPSSGSTLTQAQSALSTLAMNTSSGGQTIINAPTNNSVVNGSSGGGNSNMNPYNGDLMKYLLKPIA